MLATYNIKDIYTGDGVVTQFPYTFLVLEATHLYTMIDGIVQNTSEYTVTDIGEPTGGAVIFNTAPPLDSTVAIVREVPLDQLMDYKPYDPFPAESHEEALDKLTMITQQLQEQLDRTLQGPIDDPSFVPTAHFTSLLDTPASYIGKATYLVTVNNNEVGLEFVPLTALQNGVLVSESAPPNPINGSLWFDSKTAILWVYYVDADTAQWVQAGDNNLS